MEIKKDQILIRTAEEKDAEILTKWWNDGKVMAHAGFPNGLNTTVDKVIDQIKAQTYDHGRLILEVNYVPSGEMSFRRVNENSVEIGIKICDFSLHNQGIGKKALSLLIKELFQMGFKEIILDTNLNNTRAQHVYQTLGFTQVKVNINAWQDQLGVWQSSIDYSLKEDAFIDHS